MVKNNLSLADNIPPPSETFDDIVSFVSKCMNIVNIELVERPPWVYDLFHDDADARR
jgi:hypothetical protein